MKEVIHDSTSSIEPGPQESARTTPCHWWRHRYGPLLGLRPGHPLSRPIHPSSLFNYGYHLFLYYAGLGRITIVQYRLPFLRGLRRRVSGRQGCLHHRLDLLVLLVILSHGGLDGRRPIHAVLDTLVTPMDSSPSSFTNSLIHEFNGGQTLRRTRILVCPH